METLRAEGIGKSYKGRQVVRGVDLHISRGEVVGLLGPNGAGKTTIFYMIVGLVVPETGRVIVDDKDITRTPMYLRARFRHQLSAPGAIGISQAHCRRKHHGRPRGSGALRPEAAHEGGAAHGQLNLDHIRVTQGYALSGGERRRVEIARCLCIQPNFILLDEPFSGIDPIAVLDLQKIIFDLKASGIGILITDHNVRETLQCGPSLHHRRRQNLPRRHSARTRQRPRSASRLPRRRLLNEVVRKVATAPPQPKLNCVILS